MSSPFEVKLGDYPRRFVETVLKDGGGSGGGGGGGQRFADVELLPLESVQDSFDVNAPIQFVAGKALSVHGVVLASASNTLKSPLRDAFNMSASCVIMLPDVEASTVAALAAFLYTGTNLATSAAACDDLAALLSCIGLSPECMSVKALCDIDDKKCIEFELCISKRKERADKPPITLTRLSVDDDVTVLETVVGSGGSGGSGGVGGGGLGFSGNQSQKQRASPNIFVDRTVPFQAGDAPSVAAAGVFVRTPSEVNNAFGNDADPDSSEMSREFIVYAPPQYPVEQSSETPEFVDFVSGSVPCEVSSPFVDSSLEQCSQQQAESVPDYVFESDSSDFPSFMITNVCSVSELPDGANSFPDDQGENQVTSSQSEEDPGFESGLPPGFDYSADFDNCDPAGIVIDSVGCAEEEEEENCDSESRTPCSFMPSDVYPHAKVKTERLDSDEDEGEIRNFPSDTSPKIATHEVQMEQKQAFDKETAVQDSEQLSCRFCGKTFAKRQALMTHMYNAHGRRRSKHARLLKRDICKVEIKTEESDENSPLDSDLEPDAGEEGLEGSSVNIRCSYCEKTFASKAGLSIHQKHAHFRRRKRNKSYMQHINRIKRRTTQASDDLPPPTLTKRYKCDFCAFRAYHMIDVTLHGESVHGKDKQSHALHAESVHGREMQVTAVCEELSVIDDSPSRPPSALDRVRSFLQSKPAPETAHGAGVESEMSENHLHQGTLQDDEIPPEMGHHTSAPVNVVVVPSRDECKTPTISVQKQESFLSPQSYSSISPDGKGWRFKKKKKKIRCSVVLSEEQIADFGRKVGNRDWVCRRCGKHAPSLSDLERHVNNVHLKLRPFRCHLCPYDITSRGGIRAHLQREHGIAQEDDELNFNPRGSYLTKSLANDVEGKLKVTREPPPPEVVEVHEERQCPECPNTFSNETSLEAHINDVHRKVFALNCELCAYKTNWQANLNLHMDKVHEGETKNTDQKRQLKVEPKNSGPTTDQRQMKTEALDEESLEDTHNLTTSEEDHSDDAPQKSGHKFECGFCEKILFSANYLKRHIQRFHSRNKAGKSSLRASHPTMTESTISHAQLTKRRRTFFAGNDKCTCGEVTGSWGKLLHHIDTVHLGIRSFGCPLCPKNISWFYTLRRHVKVAHGETSGTKRDTYRLICEPKAVSAASEKIAEETSQQSIDLPMTATQSEQENSPSVETESTISRTELKRRRRGYMARKDKCTCGKVTGSYVTLLHHIDKVHLGIRSFGCQLCPQNNGWLHILQNHIKLEHGGTSGSACDTKRDTYRIRCNSKVVSASEKKAGETSPQSIDLPMTASDQSRQENLPQSTKTESTISRVELKKRRSEFVAEQCLCVCGMTTTSYLALHHHIDRVHLGIMSFGCQLCPRTSSWCHSLRKHIKVSHGEASGEKIDTYRITCELRVASDQNDGESLPQSTQLSTTELVMSLDQLQQRREKFMVGKSACTCGEEKTSTTLLHHIDRVHLCITSFSCQLCLKKSTWCHDLQAHIKRVHGELSGSESATKLESYIIKCESGPLSRDSSLQSYQPMVTEESPSLRRQAFIAGEWVCTCGEVKKSREALLHHIDRFHLQVPDLQCPYCPKRLAWKCDMQRHIKREHRLEHESAAAVIDIHQIQSEPTSSTASDGVVLNVSKPSTSEIKEKKDPKPPMKPSTSEGEENIDVKPPVKPSTSERREKRDVKPAVTLITSQSAKSLVSMPSYNSSEAKELAIMREKFIDRSFTGTGSKMKCAGCGRILADNTMLYGHIDSRHLGVRAYKCLLCGYAASFADCLYKHMRGKHNVYLGGGGKRGKSKKSMGEAEKCTDDQTKAEKSTVGEIKAEQFNENTTKAEQSVTDNEPTISNVLRSAVDRRSEFVDRTRYGVIYSRCVCGEEHDDKAQLDRHIDTVHLNPPAKFTCKQCSYTTISREMLSEHTNSKHGVKQSEESESPAKEGAQSDECDSPTDEDASEPEPHRASASSSHELPTTSEMSATPRSAKCNVCEFSSSSRTKMALHLCTHLDSKQARSVEYKLKSLEDDAPELKSEKDADDNSDSSSIGKRKRSDADLPALKNEEDDDTSSSAESNGDENRDSSSSAAESKPVFKCPTCDKAFKLQLQLNIHVKMVHSKKLRKDRHKNRDGPTTREGASEIENTENSKDKDEPSTPEIASEKDNNEDPDGPTSEIASEKKHKPFTCSLCKRSFQLRHLLQRHVAKHHFCRNRNKSDTQEKHSRADPKSAVETVDEKPPSGSEVKCSERSAKRGDRMKSEAEEGSRKHRRKSTRTSVTKESCSESADESKEGTSKRRELSAAAESEHGMNLFDVETDPRSEPDLEIAVEPRANSEKRSSEKQSKVERDFMSNSEFIKLRTSRSTTKRQSITEGSETFGVDKPIHEEKNKTPHGVSTYSSENIASGSRADITHRTKRRKLSKESKVPENLSTTTTPPSLDVTEIDIQTGNNTAEMEQHGADFGSLPSLEYFESLVSERSSATTDSEQQSESVKSLPASESTKMKRHRRELNAVATEQKAESSVKASSSSEITPAQVMDRRSSVTHKEKSSDSTKHHTSSRRENKYIALFSSQGAQAQSTGRRSSATNNEKSSDSDLTKRQSSSSESSEKKSLASSSSQDTPAQNIGRRSSVTENTSDSTKHMSSSESTMRKSLALFSSRSPHSHRSTTNSNQKISDHTKLMSSSTSAEKKSLLRSSILTGWDKPRTISLRKSSLGGEEAQTSTNENSKNISSSSTSISDKSKSTSSSDSSTSSAVNDGSNASSSSRRSSLGDSSARNSDPSSGNSNIKSSASSSGRSILTYDRGNVKSVTTPNSINKTNTKCSIPSSSLKIATASKIDYSRSNSYSGNPISSSRSGDKNSSCNSLSGTKIAAPNSNDRNDTGTSAKNQTLITSNVGNRNRSSSCGDSSSTLTSGASGSSGSHGVVRLQGKRWDQTGSASPTSAGSKCTHCGQIYENHVVLKVHVEAAHPRMQYNCQLCSYQAAWEVGLLNHMAREHGE